MVKKYRSKERYRVVQYTGKNFDEINEFCKFCGFELRKPKNKGPLYFKYDGDVHVGDFVVKKGSDELGIFGMRIYDPISFHEKFEEL